MKISFYDPGDPTVGLGGWVTSWELDSDFGPGDELWREEVRTAANKLYEATSGESITGVFEDECGECNGLMTKREDGTYTCPHAGCLSNWDGVE